MIRPNYTAGGGSCNAVLLRLSTGRCGWSIAWGAAQEYPLNLSTMRESQPAKHRGIRYYMPKPYLLITELPRVEATQTVTATTKTGGDAKLQAKPPPADGGDGGGGGADGKGSPSKTTNSSTTQAAAVGQGTDLSYSAVSGNYQLKLIYLPDMSRQMAITMNAGSLVTRPSNQPFRMAGC